MSSDVAADSASRQPTFSEGSSFSDESEDASESWFRGLAAAQNSPSCRDRSPGRSPSRLRLSPASIFRPLPRLSLGNRAASETSRVRFAGQAAGSETSQVADRRRHILSGHHTSSQTSLPVHLLSSRSLRRLTSASRDVAGGNYNSDDAKPRPAPQSKTKSHHKRLFARVACRALLLGLPSGVFWTSLHHIRCDAGFELLLALPGWAERCHAGGNSEAELLDFLESEYSDSRQLQSLLLSVATLILGYLVSSRLALALQKWNEGRAVVFRLTTTARVLVSQLCGYIGRDDRATIRMLVDLRRLLVLATALMVSHVATRDGDAATEVSQLERYLQIGLITPSELRQLRDSKMIRRGAGGVREAFPERTRLTLVVFWMREVLTEIQRRGGRFQMVHYALAVDAQVTQLSRDFEAIESLHAPPRVPTLFHYYMVGLAVIYMLMLPLEFLPALGLYTPLPVLCVACFIVASDEVARDMEVSFRGNANGVDLLDRINTLDAETAGLLAVRSGQVVRCFDVFGSAAPASRRDSAPATSAAILAATARSSNERVTLSAAPQFSSQRSENGSPRAAPTAAAGRSLAPPHPVRRRSLPNLVQLRARAACILQHGRPSPAGMANGEREI